MKSKNERIVKTIISVNTENLSLNDNLKLRMIQLKGELPEVYMPVYEDHYGIQPEEIRVRIRECVNLRITDEQITKNWEMIVKKKRDKEARKIGLNTMSVLAHEINETAAKNKAKK